MKFILAVLVCLLLSTSAGAVVYVDCRAPGSVHNGASWGTAYLTISQALASLPYGGAIWVKAGVYNERLTINTYISIYGGFLGFETSADQRLIGAFSTLISGGRRGRVIDIPIAARVTLDGLNIRDGKADRGGGIRCSTNSTVTIRNCRVENCQATEYAGGIYYDTYAQGRVENCVIARNRAPRGGGAVIEYHSYPTLHGNVIVRNQASISGGGLYCPFHSGAVLENCTIAYNKADINGGGLYVYYGGPVTLRACIVAFNSAPEGGGFCAGGGSCQAVLTSTDWYGNSVGNLGGALISLPADGGNISADPAFVMPGKDEYHLMPWSSCGGLGAYAFDSACVVDRIGTVKLLGDGTAVKLTNKVVSCVDGEIAYIQEPDRTAGIALRGVSGLAPGRIVTNVCGSLSTQNGCRVLIAFSFALSQTASYSPKPLGVRLSWLDPLVGVSTVIWGRVDSAGAGGFVLNDGSRSVVVRSAGTGFDVGDYVSVPGVFTIDGDYFAWGIPVRIYPAR